jgi:hypothetical protein
MEILFSHKSFIQTQQKTPQSGYEYVIAMDNILNFVDPNISDERRVKWVKRGLRQNTLKLVNLHNTPTMAELALHLSKDDEFGMLLSSRLLLNDNQETFHLSTHYPPTIQSQRASPHSFHERLSLLEN